MPLTPEERRARQRAAQQRYRERDRNRANSYYWKHRDEIRAKQRERYLSDPDRVNRDRLRKLEREAGRPKPESCEICGDSGVRITFDHCHQRDLFRGWICQSCNAILGLARDSPDRLRKVIAYLERTKDLIPPQLTLPI
jgi:hypothetical protein